MSRTAGPEVVIGAMEKPPEGQQEAQIANNFFQAEIQQLFAPHAQAAPDNQNQNSDVQAMLGGFGIVNALAQNDNSLANPDALPQPYLQLAQNDGPLAGANSIGVIQNVFQALSDVGTDAAGSDDPTPAPANQDAPPPPPPPPSEALPSNSGDQTQPPSMGLPQWMLNFMN